MEHMQGGCLIVSFNPVLQWNPWLQFQRGNRQSNKSYVYWWQFQMSSLIGRDKYIALCVTYFRLHRTICLSTPKPAERTVWVRVFVCVCIRVWVVLVKDKVGIVWTCYVYRHGYVSDDGWVSGQSYRRIDGVCVMTRVAKLPVIYQSSMNLQ